MIIFHCNHMGKVMKKVSEREMRKVYGGKFNIVEYMKKRYQRLREIENALNGK